MSDQEKTKKLASEVMGWRPHCRNSAWYVDANKVNSLIEDGRDIKANVSDFDPFTNSADNDALVEAYLGKWNVANLAYDRTANGWRVFIEMWKLIESTSSQHAKYNYRSEWQGDYTTAKKNKAVCEAILQAIGGAV